MAGKKGKSPQKKRATIRNKDFAGLMEAMQSPLTEDSFPVFEEILSACVKSLDSRNPFPGLTPSRLAVVAARAACAAKTPRAAAACFKVLAGLGQAGVIQSAALLKKSVLSLDEVFELFVELPVAERLEVVDQLLRDPGALDPQLRTFARERLAELSGEYVHELKRFVLHAGPLSYAVRGALMEGPIGDHCRSVFDSPGKIEELGACMRLCCRSMDRGSLGDLVAHIESGREDVRSCILSGMGDHPVESDRNMVKAVIKALISGKGEVKRQALNSLVSLKPAKLPEVCAGVFVKLPNLRPALISMLPRFSHNHFMAFLKGLPAPERKPVMFALFRLLCETDPAGMRTTIQFAADKHPAAKKAAGVVAAYLPEHEPAWNDPPMPPKKEQKTKKSKESFFGFGKKKDIVEFGEDDEAGDLGGGKHYKARDFSSRDFDKARYKGVFFEECTFSKAAFKNCDFSGAVFRNCKFEDVRFADTDLSGTWWHECRMERAELDGVFLDGAIIEGVTGSMIRVSATDFSGASVNVSEWTCLALDNVDLSGTTVSDSAMSGVLFRDVLFCGTLFSHTSLHSTDFESCLFDGCAVIMCEASHPALLELEEQSFGRRLDETLFQADDPPENLGRDAFSLITIAVNEWFHVRSMRTKLFKFLRDNLRKRSWGTAKLGPARAAFYRIVPYLLSSDACHEAFGLSKDTPSCRIPGYVPDLETLTFARTHFPEAGLPERTGSPMVIDSLFTIGSMGTVAQGEDSDLDYWVCARLSEASESETRLLAAKLERITQWADESLNLEAFFFLMDIEDVRANNFGFSDQESSGSAQALILKEEFYRSALLTAGAPPLWWVVPPGASEKSYASYGQKARQLLGENAILDLGHVAQIPAEEFFGASLWQIVKGLKSPFKSVMKFGLLERYTGGGTSGMLLCERIKRNILAGKAGLTDNDPYVLMYLEILDHYAKLGEEETIELMSRSFYLKAGSSDIGLRDLPPSCREERELPDIFSTSLLRGIEVEGGPARLEELSFDDIMQLGSRINQFLIKTYLKVRESQSGDIRAAITPEDLTKLGRRIFTTFSKRENKIERIPFLKTMHASFHELHVRTVQEPKEVKRWELEGGRFDESIKRAKLSNLKTGPAICPLMAWVITNGLMGKSTIVKADLSTSPVTAQDFEELLHSLADFFPPEVTFETDIGENVKPERLVRACFVINFTSPRETARPVEMTLIYSTNWGELFCVDLPADDDALVEDQAGYLRKHLTDIEIDDDFEMGLFIPSRSQCPGILMV